jgi:hypothetical protein
MTTVQHYFKSKLFEVAFYPVTVGEEAHLEQNPGHVKLITERNMSRAAQTQTPVRCFTAQNTNRAKEYQQDLQEL